MMRRTTLNPSAAISAKSASVSGSVDGQVGPLLVVLPQPVHVDAAQDDGALRVVHDPRTVAVRRVNRMGDLRSSPRRGLRRRVCARIRRRHTDDRRDDYGRGSTHNA